MSRCRRCRRHLHRLGRLDYGATWPGDTEPTALQPGTSIAEERGRCVSPSACLSPSSYGLIA